MLDSKAGRQAGSTVGTYNWKADTLVIRLGGFRNVLHHQRPDDRRGVSLFSVSRAPARKPGLVTAEQ